MVFISLDECLCLVIEALRVHLEDIRSIHCQWAVHIYRHAGKQMALKHLVQCIDDLLGAPYCKSRDDHLTTTLERPPDHLAQLIISQIRVLVRLIPIGALHDQVIRPIRQDWVADQGQLAPANVPAEP